MKKNKLSIVVAMSLIFSSSYALGSIKSSIDEGIYYCPATVSCTEAANPSSCSFSTLNPELWDRTIKFNKFIYSATYSLDSVSATFHSPEVEAVSCKYRVPGNNSDPIYISSKKESNLEIAYNKPTNWNFLDPEKPYVGECATVNGNPESCPLKEQPALIFYNANIGSVVTASINNHDISSSVSSQYKKVNFDAAINYCGGSKECRIDFRSNEGMFYGGVTVDMDNQMKIISINSINPSYVNLSQSGAYNAVEIGFVSFIK